MYQKLTWRLCALIFGLVARLLAVKAMSRSPIQRFQIVPNLHSSSIVLSQIKDSRTNGITFERHNALLLQHLQKTAPTKSLEDFSSFGPQKVFLDYSEPLEVEKSEAFLRYLTTAPILKDSIWEIEILYEYGVGNWSILADFIKTVPGVSTLKWALEFPVPAILLKALELKHPASRLYYKLTSNTLDFRVPARSSNGVRDPADIEVDSQIADRKREIDSIVNSSVLYSLTAEIDDSYSSYSRNSASEIGIIHHVLTTCPNIRELVLNMKRGRRSYHNSHGGQPVALNLSDTSKPLPPLEVLSLKNYKLETDANGKPLMEWKTGPDKLRWPLDKIPPPVIDFVGPPLIRSIGGFVKGDQYQSPVAWDKTEEETNLDMWLKVMDWTHLHTLKIQHPSTQLRKLEGGVLPSLKHVSFGAGGGCCMHELRGFLTNVSALESLSLYTISFFSPDSLINIISKHHCPTLHTLRLNRTFLNSTHLSQLLHHCPRIHTLDINMDRTETWDYGVLDTVASFKELRSLTLRFDIRRMGEDEEERDAYLGYSWAVDHEEFRDRVVDGDDETMMLALRAYLGKRKVGMKFQNIRTLIGELEVPKAGSPS